MLVQWQNQAKRTNCRWLASIAAHCAFAVLLHVSFVSGGEHGETGEVVVRAVADDPVLIWLDRATRYASVPGTKDEASIAGVTIAGVFARRGGFAAARATILGEPEEAHVRLCGIVVVQLVHAGQPEQAERFAASHDDPRMREIGYVHLSRFYANRHCFDEARRVSRMVDDESFKHTTWKALAERLAEAGEYDAALKIAEGLTAETEWQREKNAELRTLIDESRKSGRRDPPMSPPNSSPAAFARLPEMFGGSRIDKRRLEETETDASRAEHAATRASLWRQLAEEYHELGRADDSRRALLAAVRAAESIDNSYRRAVQLTLLADLHLRLGDREQARSFVRKARAAGDADELFSGLRAVALPPAFLSVLVRLNELDAAFEVAASASDDTVSSWAELGVLCGALGYADEVEDRLPQLSSDRERLLLCAGVAEGLQERERLDPNEKDRSPETE